jgi:hypothetical protein
MTLQRIFRWALPVCFAAGLLPAQVGIPHIGLVRYADGSVWAVNGLKANFVLGKRLMSGVTAASFSDAGGLVAFPGEVDLIRLDGSVVGSYKTDEGQPVLDISGGLATARIYLLSTRTMLHWNGSSFGIADGETVEPVFHQKTFALFSDGEKLEVQEADGTVRTLPISGADVKMERMADDWVHISSAAAHRDWALLLNDREMQLSELPAPREEAAK